MNAARTLVVFVLLALPLPSVRAQCADWVDTFGSPGTSGPVHAQIVFDDGSGPALYAGGSFTHAGMTQVSSLARWDGTGWSGVSGPGGTVRALAVHDDGSGPRLHAASPSVRRWDGTAWTLIGFFPFNVVVSAMATHDDGSGPALYVTGTFNAAPGGAPAAHVARWDGLNWSAVGTGLHAATTNFDVSALVVFDDGSGPALYAGGGFDNAGGVPANHVAKWNGSAWSDVGGGTNGSVFALTVHDDGSGPALYATGEFTLAGGVPANHVARWDGTAWSALGSGTDAAGRAFAVVDVGGGPELALGGAFSIADGVPAAHMALWDGSAWAPIASGTNGLVQSLVAFDDGGGERLYAGGAFTVAGGQAAFHVASWDGGTLAQLGPAMPGHGLSARVETVKTIDLGVGPVVVAGGSFSRAGTATTQGVASWNGTSWSGFGTDVGMNVLGLAGFDDGSGPALYAGGEYGGNGRVSRWTGTNWAPVGGQPSLIVNVLETADLGTGPALYAGGLFHSVGGVAADGIARWNGTSWSSVGGGLTFTGQGGAWSMLEFDDGSGPALYVGGRFTAAGGVPAVNVARWNGTSWSALGAGLPDTVYSFAVFDDGSGPKLYASGGSLTGVRRWTGTTWEIVASIVGAPVWSLAVHDDGSGPALFAGGSFSQIGGTPAANLAKWDGTNWTALGVGASDPVKELAVFDDGSGAGPSLYAGGWFQTVGAKPSFYFAEWRRCSATGVPFCSGDGLASACPCGNSGQAGRGCENSATTGGAELAADGTTSPDTVTLSASGELPSALSIFLQGSAPIPPVAFGDGLRCVGGSLKRLYTKNAVGGAVTAPGVGEPSITTQSAALGDPIAPGSTRWYQTYYRDPALGFCAPPAGNSWNVTNGIAIAW